MGTFVSGLGALFGGKKGLSAYDQARQQLADESAQQNKLLEQIAQNNAAQRAQDAADETDKNLAASTQPRGRRLLLSPESGGVAQKLGHAA